MLDLADLHISPALLRVQQGYGWHMHDGYMFGGGWGAAGAIIHVIFWLLIVAAIVAVTLLIARGRGGKPGEGGQSALDQLDERYAKGEIDREEYLQRKKDITER